MKAAFVGMLLFACLPQKPLDPTIFAPGEICTGEYESHPEFTTDGQTMYFVRSDPEFTHWTIYTSALRKGHWTKPAIAPFSGKNRDADPFITPDGKRFFFISDRPVDGQPKKDMDIWYMDRSGGDWGAPVHLGPEVNTARDEWYPTAAKDGTLYFGSIRKGGKGSYDIWVSKFVAGKYAEAENAGDAINTKDTEIEPFITPDGNRLIFTGFRPDSLGGFDFYISEKMGGAWQTTRHLGKPLSSAETELSPKISRDGKSFFFTSDRGDKPPEGQSRKNTPGNGLGDIYTVDVGLLGQKG